MEPHFLKRVTKKNLRGLLPMLFGQTNNRWVFEAVPAYKRCPCLATALVG